MQNASSALVSIKSFCTEQKQDKTRASASLFCWKTDMPVIWHVQGTFHMNDVIL